MIAHSQLAPLPSELPFQIVSKTIGQGAYACIKKGQIPGRPQVFAVKFIHKAFALRHGHVTPKQLDLEAALHRHLGAHPHVVQYFQDGADAAWRWIAMELAEGGDLFDKIEADVGVGSELAHAYFRQLLAAVAFMHARGVAHRDLKPENVLLSASGDLKVADFGLAALFEYKGERKTCATSCGSPPYTAPEVLACGPSVSSVSDGSAAAKKRAYHADAVDLWSCGIVLFVLLVGNTPWDEPRAATSAEFAAWAADPNGGAPPPPGEDELWDRVPAGVKSLLQGLLHVAPARRFRLADVERHPWVARPNRHLAPDGRLADGVATATDLFGRMRIDFAQDPLAGGARARTRAGAADGQLGATVPDSQNGNGGGGSNGGDDAMELDAPAPASVPTSGGAASQPDTPTAEIAFDWETGRRPLRTTATARLLPASQPSGHSAMPLPPFGRPSQAALAALEEDPLLSQFSQAGSPALPLSCSQLARRFADVLPAHTLDRFVSAWPLPRLLTKLVSALRRLRVPVADPADATGAEGHMAGGGGSSGGGSGGGGAWLRVRTLDDCRERLTGDVLLEPEAGAGLVQVVFVKAKGDPLQWRRLFKRVVLLCEEAVLRPA